MIFNSRDLNIGKAPVCALPSTPWRDDCRGDRDGALGVLDDEQEVCARPSTPWRDDCRGDRDGALGVLDNEQEAQVARSF